MTRPVALTIAGSDSGGGAGIVADLKTFEAHGAWGTVAVTAVTAQNSLGVQRLDVLDPALVRAQIDTVMADVHVDAAKTGMLGDAGVVEAVAESRAQIPGPLVVDPVLVSTSGTGLLDEDGLLVLRDRLLPLATLVTPNLAEAAVLTRRPVHDRPTMVVAARHLVDLGCTAALVTGGHLGGDTIADCLVVGDRDPLWLERRRVLGPGSHGTGCVLSAAITARLACAARSGPLADTDIVEACGAAAVFVGRAIAAGIRLGRGPGAVDPGAVNTRSTDPEVTRQSGPGVVDR